MTKKVTLDLTTLDSNVFALLGAFQERARRARWTPQEIKEVLSEATKSDYDHAIATLTKHCEP